MRPLADVEVDGLGPCAPVGHRRRRHVVAHAQAPRPADPRLPRRVARLPAVLHATSPARRATVCTSGSSPTCSPATPGRSRSPGGRANIGFGIHAGQRPPGPGHEGASGPSCSPAPAHRATSSGPTPRRGPPPGLAHPRPHRRGHAHRRAHPVRGDAATATDPMTGEGIGQALLTGRLAAETISPTAVGRGRGPQPPTSTRSHRDLVADHRMSAARMILASRHAAPAAAVRAAGPTTGPGATSPAGCSRTTRAPLLLTPRARLAPGDRSPGSTRSRRLPFEALRTAHSTDSSTSSTP